MRITKIEIENFGKLSGISESFSEGINQIYQENGFGKTTMAHFVKVMLFGFENEGKRKGLTERNYYRPWNGGQYGGRLYFSVNGKDYILSKVFGIKDKDDKASLINQSTGLESDDFSTCPGPELFGLDTVSYNRSAYFGQNDLYSEVTQNIQGRADIGGDPTDIARFDSLYDVLQSEIKNINGRSKTAVFKVLNEKKSSIDASLRRLPEIEKKQLEIKDYIGKEKAMLLEAEGRLEGNKSLMDKSSAQESLKNLKEQYTSKLLEKNRREKEYKDNLDFFKNGVLSDSEYQDIYNHIEDREEDLAKLEIYTWDVNDEAVLNQLSESFTLGIPDEDFAEAVKRDISELKAIKTKMYENKPSEDELSALKELKVYDGLSQNVIDSLADSFEEYSREKATLLAEEKALSDRRKTLMAFKTDKKNNSSQMPLYIIGGLALVAGIALFFVNQVVGIVLSVAGIASLAIAFALSRRNTFGDALTLEEEGIKSEAERLESRAGQNRTLIENIHLELARYGLDCDEDRLKASIYTAGEKLATYEKLKASYDSYSKAGYEQSIEDKTKNIRKKLFPYVGDRIDSGADFDELLHDVSSKAKRYTDLLNRKQRHTELKQSENAHKAAYDKGLSKAGFENVDDPKAFLIAIRNKMNDIRETREEFEHYDTEFENFCEGKNIEEIAAFVPDESLKSLPELTEINHMLNKEIDEIKGRISNFEHQLDEAEKECYALYEQSSERDIINEQMEHAKEYLDIAEKTARFLSEAKTSFTAKYTAPIMNSFRKYMDMIAPGLASAFEMDANLKVSYREGVLQSEIESLSAGLLDITYLCLRSAMLDVIYTGDRPCLILDDPFVNLDDDKLPLAKKWLKVMSDEYQIIYYCCHSSRTV